VLCLFVYVCTLLKQSSYICAVIYLQPNISLTLKAFNMDNKANQPVTFGQITYPLTINATSPFSHSFVAHAAMRILLQRYIDNLPPLTALEYNGEADTFYLHVGDVVDKIELDNVGLRGGKPWGYLINMYRHLRTHHPKTLKREFYSISEDINLSAPFVAFKAELKCDSIFINIIKNQVWQWVGARIPESYYTLPEAIEVRGKNKACVDFATDIAVLIHTNGLVVEVPFYLFTPPKINELNPQNP